MALNLTRQLAQMNDNLVGANLRQIAPPTTANGDEKVIAFSSLEARTHKTCITINRKSVMIGVSSKTSA